MDKPAKLRPKQSATIKDDENPLEQALAELDRVGATEEREAELRTEFEQASPGDRIQVRPGYRIERLIDWTDSLRGQPAWHKDRGAAAPSPRVDRPRRRPSQRPGLPRPRLAGP